MKVRTKCHYSFSEDLASGISRVAICIWKYGRPVTIREHHHSRVLLPWVANQARSKACLVRGNMGVEGAQDTTGSGDQPSTVGCLHSDFIAHFQAHAQMTSVDKILLTDRKSLTIRSKDGAVPVKMRGSMRLTVPVHRNSARATCPSIIVRGPMASQRRVTHRVVAAGD